MPRSNYSAQYLNYGLVPNYSYKPDDTRHYNDASGGNRNSAYQQEFKEKLSMTTKISHKELDCCKDKFKYLFIEVGTLTSPSSTPARRVTSNH